MSLWSPSKEEEEKLSLDDNVLLEEDFEAGYEAEEDEEVEMEGNEEEDVEEEEVEEEVKESTKNKILRLTAQVASRVKEIVGNLITTAGQVVVTILLGLTGEQLSIPISQFGTFENICCIKFSNICSKKSNYTCSHSPQV